MKQAVLGWLNGEPNLGLLVTASTLFEDQVTVEFSRRNEYHHSKQPILVLFDDDGKRHRGDGNNEIEEASYDEEDEKNDLKNEYSDKDAEKRDRGKGQPEEAQWESENKSEYFQRQKRTKVEVDDATQAARKARDLEEGTSKRRRRETIAASSRRLQRDVRSNGAPFADSLTSMDIYERASRRERMAETIRQRPTLESSKEFRGKRSTKSHASVRQNVTECSRHELYVDFKEIGLSSSIIAPLGYSAYHCKGICETPLSQDQQPTNHATIQGIVHKMGLVKGVERPCCVPTKLLGTTILFFDDNENVVLKVYQDMIADRCGCR